MSNIKGAFAKGIFAITLFVEDLDVSIEFYDKTLGLELVYKDDNSGLFKSGETYINLLKITEASELVAPGQAELSAGIRAVYTLPFSDIDLIASDLQAAGVKLLNGPIDRPWGVRTISFQDPSGHTWEIANHTVSN